MANTGTPDAAIAAAAWSWVEKMLHDAQRTSAPSCGQRLDQHRGLDRHVERADDARALERLRRAEFLAQRHQAGHFGFGDVDFLAPEIGKGDVLNDIVVGARFSQSRHVIISESEWARPANAVVGSTRAPSRPGAQKQI